LNDLRAEGFGFGWVVFEEGTLREEAVELCGGSAILEEAMDCRDEVCTAVELAGYSA
ncbi:hypothetical protein H0H87_012036, partial [Tephrocybe sp. NHM501043]